ncbi:MAG TPA: hypothetical protein VHC96_05555 [Puia sp.]|nr:hypothetical protein [Puia sp.]
MSVLAGFQSNNMQDKVDGLLGAEETNINKGAVSNGLGGCPMMSCLTLTLIKMKIAAYLIACSLFNQAVLAQDDSWPERYRLPVYRNAPVVEGTIFTRDKDTITGRIKVIPYWYPIVPAGSHKVVNVKLSKIAKVRLGIHSVMKKMRYTDLVNLGSMGFWRLLDTAGNAAMYDYVDVVSPHYFGGKMLMVVGGSFTEIYSRAAYLLHNGHVAALLAKYIKQRLKKTPANENEDAIPDMIREILTSSRSL